MLARMREEEEQERAMIRQQARERILQDFERLQSGAGPSSSSRATGQAGGLSKPEAIAKEVIGERGTKRKFEVDGEQFDKMITEHEEKALLTMEREQAEKRKAKLPNFWLVSAVTACSQRYG